MWYDCQLNNSPPRPNYTAINNYRSPKAFNNVHLAKSNIKDLEITNERDN